MRLSSDVYFGQFGEYTYVRHVGQAKDYLLNAVSYDVLDFIRSHENCAMGELCNYLADVYEVSEKVPFKSQIEHFLEQLRQDGLLDAETSVKDVNEEPIRSFIQRTCCENHRLFTVCLELTYRCNERCVHCYLDVPRREGEELSFVEYKDILDQLKGLGCMGVLLTGGEATLHHDFFKIAEYAKGNGLIVDIYTNGVDLSNAALDRLIALKPNSVSFSFYGGTPQVHDAVTRTRGSFGKSLRSLMTVKCAGIDTYIKTVIMRENADDYEELLRLGQRLRVPVLSSLSVMPSHGGKSAERFRLLDTRKYAAILDLELKYGISDLEKAVKPRGDTICSSGLDTLSIDPFGGVHPCNAHPMLLGNVRDISIRNIWEQSERLLALRSIQPKDVSSKCADCPELDWCGLCPGSAIRENGKLAPCSDTCMIAQAYRQVCKTW